MADNIEKKILLQVETDTSNVQSGLNEVKEGLNEVKQSLDDVNNKPADKSIKSLKQELKEAKKALYELASDSSIDKTSTQFKEAVKRVADLKDEVGDLNATVDAFNSDNKLQGFVSIAQGATKAVQGVAGAMAVIGVESDTASETIARLQGLMAFSDAFSSINEITDGFKNFGAVVQSTTVFQKANAAATALASGAMKLFGVAADTTSFSFKALKVAIASTGIGLIVVAIGTLLPLISDWIKGTDNAEAAQKRLNSALEAQKDLLARDEKAIEFETKAQIAKAKVAGEGEAAIREIEAKGAEERIKALENNYKKLDEIARNNDKKRSVEDQEKANKDANDAFRQYLDAKSDLLVKDLENQAAAAEEARRKQKEASDKAKQLRKQEFESIKSSWKEIEELNKAANRDIITINLTAREKELKDLEFSYYDQLEKLKQSKQRELDYIAKYGGYKAEIEAKYNNVEENLAKDNAARKLEIEKKYHKLVLEYINESAKTEYQQALVEENNKYEEALKNAKDFNEKLAVIAAHTKKVDKIETTETNRVNTINSETNLINTQVANQVNPEDTPDERVAKLQAIWDAEKAFKEAQRAEELSNLEGNEAEIANIKAKWRQQDTEGEKAQSDARKAIVEAEKEHKLATMDLIAGASDAAAELIGKNTVAGKALAVATTTIDTYSAAQKAYASQMSVPSPDAPVRATIAAAAAVLQGLARVKAIVSVKVPAKSGSGGGATAPAVQAPSINTYALNPDQYKIQDVRVTNPQDQTVRAYIVDKDLKDQQEKSDFINKLRSF